MGAVVEVGVVAAAPVFKEGPKGERARWHRVLTRPANTEIPALHLDIGAGIVTECAAAHPCPESVCSTARYCRSTRSLCLCRIKTRTCHEVCTVVQECARTRTCLNKGLGLLAQARLCDCCDKCLVHRRNREFIIACHAVRTLRCQILAEGDAPARVLHERDLVAYLEFLCRTVTVKIDVRIGKLLFASDIRQLQHGMRSAVHRSFFHIKMEVLNAPKVADFRRLHAV